MAGKAANDNGIGRPLSRSDSLNGRQVHVKIHIRERLPGAGYGNQPPQLKHSVPSRYLLPEREIGGQAGRTRAPVTAVGSPLRPCTRVAW